MGIFKDLTGKRFSRLVAIKRDGSDRHNRAMWLCKCDCGNFTKVVSIALISGNTQSCGCYNKERIHDTSFIDLTGKKFSRWTIIEYYKRSNDGTSIWKCLCECGNIGFVTTGSLTSNNSKSCGCLRRDVTINRNKTNHPMNDPIVRAKVTGKNNPMYGRVRELNPSWKGGLSFIPYGPEWTDKLKEYIRDIFDRKCYLCDKSEIENINKLDVHHINYNKLDERIDNLMALCHGCHTNTSNNRHYYYNKLCNYWSVRYLDGIANI
jgi:hypothetical protein